MDEELEPELLEPPEESVVVVVEDAEERFPRIDGARMNWLRLTSKPPWLRVTFTVTL